VGNGQRHRRKDRGLRSGGVSGRSRQSACAFHLGIERRQGAGSGGRRRMHRPHGSALASTGAGPRTDRGGAPEQAFQTQTRRRRLLRTTSQPVERRRPARFPKRLERSPSELNRGRDSRIGFDLLEDRRRGKEAAGMALSDDLRERVVGAVVQGGMSRNAAAKRFGVSIASAVRWVARFKAKGEISPAPTGGDRRSGRIEALRDYLFGLIGRRPDMT